MYQVLIVYKFNGNVATSIAQFKSTSEAEQAIVNLEEADTHLSQLNRIETYKLWKGKE